MATNGKNSLNLAMSVSGGNLSRKHTLNLTLDFTGVEHETLLGWAADSRVIALQRVLRATSDSYLDELGGKLAIHANACGSKIMTMDDQIEALVKTVPGMTRDMARTLLTNPTMLDALAGGK